MLQPTLFRICVVNAMQSGRLGSLR